MLDQPERLDDRNAGLAGAGGHVDERPLAVLRERPFKRLHGRHLDLPQPPLVEGRERPDALAQDAFLVGHPAEQRLGPVEGEDIPGHGCRFEQVREERLEAGRDVVERQRQTP